MADDFLKGIAIGLVLGGALVYGVTSAKAEDLVADVSDLAYCSIYSREAARIDIMHTRPVDMAMAGPTYPEDLAFAIYKQCVSILPTMLPLPEEHRSLESWNADMVAWIGKHQGVEPALSSAPGDEAWRAACRATYRSWNEEDGTVVRRGSHERVKCPCGDTVVCD